MTSNINEIIRNRKFICGRSSSGRISSNRLLKSVSLYRKTLFGHFGCVNTMAFSNSQTTFASSGDDGRVLIWDSARCVSERQVSHSVELKQRHDSNVFSACFNCNDSSIISGGNDERILVQDIDTNKLLRDIGFSTVEIFCVDAHPQNPSLCLAGASRGKVFRVDFRESSDNSSSCDLQLMTRKESFWSCFRCVKFNPVDPTYFVAASSTRGVTLRDLRKPNSVITSFKRDQHCDQFCNDKENDVMYCCFDQSGAHLLTSVKGPYLYLYDVSKPEKPKFHFSSSSYENNMTIKSCSFFGPNDECVVSGSDDFNVYVWKIPKNGARSLVWYPHMQLKGHRSVVNQVTYSKRFELLATSGTEKVVKIWSLYKLNQGDGGISREVGVTRERYSFDDYLNFVMSHGIMDHDYRNQSTEEDPRVLAFFDNLGGDRGQWDSDSSSEELPLRYQRSFELPTISLTAYNNSNSDNINPTDSASTTSSSLNDLYTFSESTESERSELGNAASFSSASGALPTSTSDTASTDVSVPTSSPARKGRRKRRLGSSSARTSDDVILSNSDSDVSTTPESLTRLNNAKRARRKCERNVLHLSGSSTTSCTLEENNIPVRSNSSVENNSSANSTNAECLSTDTKEDEASSQHSKGSGTDEIDDYI